MLYLLCEGAAGVVCLKEEGRWRKCLPIYKRIELCVINVEI